MRNTGHPAVILLILFFVIPGAVQAVATASVPDYQWLEDPAGTLDINQVQSLAGDRWTQFTSGKVLNFGFSDSAFWVRIRISPAAPHTNRVLDVGYPLLDVVDLFWVSGGRVIQQYQTGDTRPFTNRPIVHRDFIFPVPVSSDPVTAYLKIESQGPVQVPVALLNSSDFLASEQLAYGWQAMFFGIIVALALYNLFLFLIIRERTYLWYVLTVITMGLAQLNFHGVLFQWFWPGLPGVNRYFTVVIIGLAIISAIVFAIRFLNVRRYSPYGYRLLWLTIFCSASIIIYGLFGSYQAGVALVSMLAAIGAPGLWVLGLYIWWRGQKLAVFYALAWTPLLLGNTLLAISKLGYVADTFITEVGPQIGVAIETVLLSFALAYRINLERHQRLLAQNKALEIQREANLTLETRVRERTGELQLANERLEAISLTDGLTQVANRRQLDQRLQVEWNRALRHSQPLSFLLLDIDHFKAVNDERGHLVGDDCLVALAAICSDQVPRSCDLLARYGGEEFGVLLPATSEPGARQVAERLREAVERTPIHSSTLGAALNLTVSVGYASMIPQQNEQPSELIRRADEALYAAKTAGRNRTCSPPGAGHEPD
jgi:diguanylate cyclase (GGDEF)-like protein